LLIAATLDDFCAATHPGTGGQFCAFDFEGTPVKFKVDRFREDLSFHSPDPIVTERITTIKLAEK
jgi:hypothetical protein